jgi:hypothetical protein
MQQDFSNLLPKFKALRNVLTPINKLPPVEGFAASRQREEDPRRRIVGETFSTHRTNEIPATQAALVRCTICVHEIHGTCPEP